MAGLFSMLKELWGVFVDDGSLAVALVVWVAISALVLPRLSLPVLWDGPMLFAGCLVILAINVLRAAKRKEG